MSGESEAVGDNDCFPLKLIVTVTVFVTPVGNVVGLAVNVFTEDQVGVTEAERLVLAVTDCVVLTELVLEFVLLPVIVRVVTTVNV